MVNYAPLLNAPDIGQQFAQGVQQGRETRLMGQRDSALQALSANPNDPNAINALMAVDPRTAMAFEERGARQREAEAQAQRQQLFAQAYNPQTGAIDPTKARQAYVQTGDIEGAMKFDANQAAAQKAQLENAVKQIEVASQILGTATDQASYTAALQRAQSLGIDVSREPQQFDPAYVQQQIAMGLDAKEKLANQWKKLDYDLNVAKFGNQVQQQNIDNQFQAGQLALGQANLGMRQAEFGLRTAEATGALPNKQAKRDEGALRKEFEARPEIKNFREVVSSYRQIREAAQQGTAAGDLQMIFSYMKMLDPGSVVREGEFANAQNTAGIPDRVRNAYNRALSGQRLNPNQRKEFMASAGSVVLARRKDYEALSSQYRGIASDYGANPDRVARLLPPLPAKGAGGPKRIQSDADYAKLPKGAVYIAPDGSTRRKP